MAIIRHARYGHSTSAEYREGKMHKKLTLVYDVQLESTDPDPISGYEVQRLRGLPIPGFSVCSPRPGWVVPFTICKTSTPTPSANNLRHWKVTCTYESAGDEEAQPDTADPASLAPKIEPFVQSSEAVMNVDYEGKKIVDPFEDLFAEPMRAPIALRGVKVVRYVTGFNENTLADWLHVTNNASWRNQPEDAWCVTDVTGQEVQFGKFTIGQLTFTILSNPLELTIALGSAAPALHRIGWLGIRAARSTTYIDSNGDRVVNRLTTSGSPPMLTWVDKDGNKSEEPYYQAFRIRKQKNFSEIV